MLDLAVSLPDLVPQVGFGCLLFLDSFLHELHLSPRSFDLFVLLARELLELLP